MDDAQVLEAYTKRSAEYIDLFGSIEAAADVDRAYFLRVGARHRHAHHRHWLRSGPVDELTCPHPAWRSRASIPCRNSSTTLVGSIPAAPTGGTDPGPRNVTVDAQNPDLFVPPKTDAGILPNLRFSFSDAHMRLERGGWTRQITVRELPVSTNMAGVDMRLNAGGVREMHWHKEAEWAYMLYGNARITTVDDEGRNFIDDVGVGDLWYFPPGLPHSIQGLGPDGCEFLLVFDDGSFSEDNTFLFSDWVKHTPQRGAGARISACRLRASRTRPTRPALHLRRQGAPGRWPRPGPQGVTAVAAPTSSTACWRRSRSRRSSGAVRITDSKNFPVATAIAAALVEVSPAACASCTGTLTPTSGSTIIEGQARMGVFGSTGNARTFDYRAGDVGYVPFAMGHYVENTGTGPLRFLEMFKSAATSPTFR